MKKFYKLLQKWLFVYAAAFLLMFIQVVYMTSPWVLWAEEEVAKKVNRFEIIESKHHPLKDSITYINTAGSKAILNIATETDSAQVAITDRKKLAIFFNYLKQNKNQHKFLLCDIRFPEKSDDDGILLKSIDGLHKVVFARHFDEKDSTHTRVDDNLIQTNTGIADYITYESELVKMILIREGHKSIPLIMYEQINNRTYHEARIGLKDNYGNWSPNSIYPKYYVNPEELDKRQISLNSVLTMMAFHDTTFYNSMFKDRIIAIGDFENDIHAVQIGRMPGTLLLVNFFLSLEKGLHQYNFLLLLLIYLCFVFICWYYFFYVPKKLPKNSWLVRFKMNKWIEEKHLITLVILLSLLISFLFNVRIALSPILVYFILLELINKIIKYYSK